MEIVSYAANVVVENGLKIEPHEILYREELSWAVIKFTDLLQCNLHNCLHLVTVRNLYRDI